MAAIRRMGGMIFTYHANNDDAGLALATQSSLAIFLIVILFLASYARMA